MYITKISIKRQSKAYNSETKKRKAVIIVWDTSFLPDIHIYKCYRRNHRRLRKKLSEGHYLETKKGGTLILARHTSIVFNQYTFL